jgi:hypothetical protein
MVYGGGGRSINKKCCSQHWHLPFPAHINAGGLSAIKNLARRQNFSAILLLRVVEYNFVIGKKRKRKRPP